jgi:hypothetical protein
MPLVIRWVIAVMGLLVTASCTTPRDDAAPVASMAVSIAPTQAAIGTPIEVRYRFEALPGASMPPGRHIVFVHAVDSSGRMVWTDDHEPPVPTERWQTGRPVEYTRTMFVPRVTVGGAVDIRIGLYSGTTGPGGELRRLRRGLAQPGSRGDAGARMAVVRKGGTPLIPEPQTGSRAVARAGPAGGGRGHPTAGRTADRRGGRGHFSTERAGRHGSSNVTNARGHGRK